MEKEMKETTKNITTETAETVKTKEVKVAKESVFSVLSRVDVSKYVKVLKKKNKQTGAVTELPYLPWASCLGLLQMYYPDVDYYVVEYDRYGIEIPRDTHVLITEKLSETNSVAFNGVMHGFEYRKDGNGLVVTTSMTIEGITRRMTLPVYDYYGAVVREPDPNLLNKARWRCLVKNAAMFGLGIDLYAGEDMPDDNDIVESLPQNRVATKTVPVTEEQTAESKDTVDAMKHVIETESPESANAVGRRMSSLIERKTDASMKALQWYAEHGSENDNRAAKELLEKAKEEKKPKAKTAPKTTTA